MLKNFLTYCHALREIRYWRKEHTFVRKSACCGIILHGFEFSVWYATWITVLQKVKHVLRVYSPTFNIYQYIYIFSIFDTKNPSNSTHSAVTLAWYIFLSYLPTCPNRTYKRKRLLVLLEISKVTRVSWVPGRWNFREGLGHWATLFCRYKVANVQKVEGFPVSRSSIRFLLVWFWGVAIFAE